MADHESFGQCLQRLLNERNLSASAAASLVGFRSRNSIFRILNGVTSMDVDARFLAALKQALGEQWPEQAWTELETALEIKRVGLQQHLANQAFWQGVYACGATRRYVVETGQQGDVKEVPLEALLKQICSEGEKISVVICGCCERSLTNVLASCLNDAGCMGRLTVRHYIDVADDALVCAVLGVLPLVSKVWYNARLVEKGHCPPEMAALYRLNIICVSGQLPDGQSFSHHLLQCDSDRFLHLSVITGDNPLVDALDRCRYQLEILKPMGRTKEGVEAFVEYTAQYARLESEGMILSIKPDVHFNLIPPEMLYHAIAEGFGQAGLASGEGLTQLLQELERIHEQRVRSICGKRRPTHLVYSLHAMEQFMRTGVQSDHFFIQRAYTVEERRAILRRMLSQMQEDPYFHIWFLRDGLPEIRSEMTMYEGKGVLLMDAYTSYDLHDDHSEALITVPAFIQSFQRFFMDALLDRMVLSRAESIAALERLISM